jgi:small conductance mechanosensitive channel
VTKWVQNKAPPLLVKILTFSLIVYLFVLLARIANRVHTRTLDSSRLLVSRLLRRVAVSTTQNVIMIMGILIALSQMGNEIAPMLACLGIAGFILGFALQDTLYNFFPA